LDNNNNIQNEKSPIAIALHFTVLTKGRWRSFVKKH